MAATKREERVFIASPGDLALERQSFREAINQLNVGFGKDKAIKERLRRPKAAHREHVPAGPKTNSPE